MSSSSSSSPPALSTVDAPPPPALRLCRVCAKNLPETSFAAKRMNTCRQCAYKKYRVEPLQRLAADERALFLLVMATQSRERGAGVRPVPALSMARTREIIEHRFERKSSVTGLRIDAVADMSLTRADPALPFDLETNAALLTHTECRRRARLTQVAKTATATRAYRDDLVRYNTAIMVSAAAATAAHLARSS